MSNVKERGGAVLSPNPQTETGSPKWLPSTNYTTQIIMFLGSLFTFFTFSESQVGQAVASLYAVIGFIMLVREKAKTGIVVGWKAWIQNPNTFAYLGALITPFLPNIAPELVKAIEAIVQAFGDGNWQQIITAVLSFLSFLFFQLRGKTGTKTVATMFVLVLFYVPGNAQVGNRRAYNANLEELKKDTFDILPQPGEHVISVAPMAQRRDGTFAAPTNWGATEISKGINWTEVLAKWKTPVFVRIDDTGSFSDHSFLQKGQVRGQSFTSVKDPVDLNGHGTHCAGIITIILKPAIDAGLVNFGLYQILGSNGAGNFQWFADCENALLDQTKTNLAKGTRTVISCSFGGNSAPIQSVERAMEAQTKQGAVYVVANGNTGAPNNVQYPGKSQYAIGCAALAQNLTRASYSSQGPETWAAMPGSNINSTYLNNTEAVLSGTSMATPALAAVTALAIGVHGPKLPDYLAVKKFLEWCAQDLPPAGKDDGTGWGIEYIKAIVEKDPANIPGNPGGPTPPNPPNPPTPPVTVFPPAPFTYVFGGYTVVWDNAATATEEVRPFKVSKKVLANIAAKPVKITKIEVEGITTMSEPEELKRTKANIDWMLTNRGFMLPPGDTYADCLRWVPFFTEMILETQRSPKQVIRVTRIEGESDKGEQFVLTDKQLKHFNKASNVTTVPGQIGMYDGLPSLKTVPGTGIMISEHSITPLDNNGLKTVPGGEGYYLDDKLVFPFFSGTRGVLHIGEKNESPKGTNDQANPQGLGSNIKLIPYPANNSGVWKWDGKDWVKIHTIDSPTITAEHGKE